MDEFNGKKKKKKSPSFKYDFRTCPDQRASALSARWTRERRPTDRPLEGFSLSLRRVADTQVRSRLPICPIRILVSPSPPPPRKVFQVYCVSFGRYVFFFSLLLLYLFLRVLAAPSGEFRAGFS